MAMVQDITGYLCLSLALLLLTLVLHKVARKATGNGAGKPRLPPGPWRPPRPAHAAPPLRAPHNI
uniref:Uncharacterized protein n=1 Tax=Oryza barthii TaxID=65489 RepID=A0A0D3F1P2_9ORYZ